MLTPIVFTTTSKSRPLMILDGYLYTRDRRTDTKTYWHCENQKSLNCHYRLHTCNSTSTETHILILKQTGTHLTSCNRDLIKITLRKFRKDVLDRTKSTQETTNAVLSQCSSKLPDPARIKLPPLDHIKRTMQKQRKRIDLPPAPNNMDFPCIPTILQTTKRNDNFLRIDTDPEFAPTWSPRIIMLAFEKAVANVLSNNFPQVCLSGCYFHLRQSIHRKLQEQGLQKKSEDDVGFAHGIHKMAALAFINPNDVINAFADVSTHLGDDFQRCVFQCSHSTLWKFIDKLILEEDSQIHTKIARVNAEEPTTKKKKYEYLDKRLLNLVLNPHQNVIDQISGLAHNIIL
ncbi:unnamed protein product [Rotaria socialis]|uniref:FLYWCH-type domain-containing protein n=1 Tax=Rotaria socialis TaxID=392032 RepID=A0A817M696_9BILA|nr:unnamed protein product [Rotaria socialis]CAF3610977.1 unnamed protein product [Rotaria socialis]CAF3617155.1 unnamed protein product [Rotaria socialis]CAF4195870.1 unnamed protein product [Rotaria socialis]CAF4325539.1 unnamed protein product [Rotaria socialis]